MTLDFADRGLVFEAALLIALASTGLHFFKFATLRRGLDRVATVRAGVGPGEPAALIGRVRRAITAVARRVPPATCLVQALAADTMLRRRGLGCRIRIGVRASTRDAGAIAAHAWVDYDGAVVLGAVDNLDDFRLLATLEPK